MITVLTPTYNRKNELMILYNSLVKQKYKNFEWLIVDDGSTDNTKAFIDKLKTKNEIKINYYYKQNGGKQSAYNYGIKKAQGEIFLCIDSDDELALNALEKINNDFKQIKNDDKCAGMIYCQGYIDNKEKIVGSNFSSETKDTYFNFYHKQKITGDKLIVLWTNIAKYYLFPIINGEKFIPEALIYNRLSLKYKLLSKNNVLAYKKYLDDGYSSNYFNLVKRNPKGNALYYLELYNIEPTIYNVYGYLLFCFYAKEKLNKILKHPSKIKVFLLYIPVKIISLIK